MNSELLMLIHDDHTAIKLCSAFSAAIRLHYSDDIEEFIEGWIQCAALVGEEPWAKARMLIDNSICDMKAKSLDPLVVSYLRREVAKHLGLKTTKTPSDE